MSALPPNRPLGVRFLNGFGAAARLAGVRWPSLDEEGLLAAARRQTGLSRFGEPHFREGLKRLLASLETESHLTTLGRLIAREDVLGYLKNRLCILDYRRRHPEVSDRRIVRPLFILGLPRTGTTVLFNLLAQDPANRAPLGWEVELPCPPPEPMTCRSDPRIRTVQKQFDRLYRLEPKLAPIHLMGALIPQECVAITAHEFLSAQFHVVFNVPSYQSWLEEQSYVRAYRFHRWFLQHLAARMPERRWVLKSPGNLPAIEDLLTVYPDACIVHTHREPLEVLPSLASLAYTLRGISSNRLDPVAVGRQQAELWERNMRRALAARRRLRDKADQFLDVLFTDITKNPIAVVERIYRHFGGHLGDTARQRMRRFLRTNPRGKHGVHRYTLEDFGLDRERDGSRFDDYRRRFGLTPEPESVPTASTG